MDDQEVFDLAVIGAGIYGIQAARTYLAIHPNDEVIVFETSGEVGGVWSTERVYDDFWTQTPLGMLEFSDLPLTGVPASETHHGFFPAAYVAGYLRSYVDSRSYAGQSLLSRIQFHSRVERLAKTEIGWNLHVTRSDGKHAVGSTFSARKVIDATGLTSNPNIPVIPGQDCYKGQIFHHKDFGQYQETITKGPESRDIAVIGGAKSAADVAYACAKAGHIVHWIIRRSGAGPAAFVAAKGSWPYKNSNESFYTRFTSHFLASWFFDESSTWLGRMMYRTSLGTNFIKACWRAINRKARRVADYDREDGRENGFYNLRPDTDIFWQNDSTGICQHDDFFDTIARKVKVYREDIKHMAPTGLKLASGTLLDVDHVIFATGWTTSHPKIQRQSDGTDLSLSLGLSVPYGKSNETSKSDYCQLEDVAEKEVLRRFPILCDRPTYYRDALASDRAPLRLYNGIIPVDDPSIAFVGQVLSGNNFRISEVQAIYAVAALDGMLIIPTRKQMETKIARMIAWSRLRYLSKGIHGSWIYWDMVPYTDYLLKELGLESHRHGQWWKDLFAPCFASDLTDLIDEYRAKVPAIGDTKAVGGEE